MERSQAEHRRAEMLEKNHPYYDVRDKTTGRFTKLNGKEPYTMTIDNDGKEITPVPATLDLGADETMIRSTMTKFADGIVKLSTFAKRIEEMEAQLNDLNARLGEACEARDKAIADAATARHDAEMARQAYDTANAKRIEAERKREERECQLKDLSVAHSNLSADHSFRGDEISRLANLLDIAAAERDSYREANGHLVDERDDALLKVLELDEAKQNLDITRQALDECAASVVEWKTKAKASQDGWDSAGYRVNELNGKVAGLEDSVANLREANAKLIDRLDTIRRTVA